MSKNHSAALGKLTMEEAAKQGVVVNHELMENGEKRFRLLAADGSSYARVVASETGGWQNGHSHTTLNEIYIVQNGWIVFAEYDQSTRKVKFRKINTGEHVSSHPGVPHNVYLFADSVYHCIKHGDLSVNDWLPHPDLDDATKKLNEKDVLELCG